MADASGRRQSVALNIVENPLKVSITSFTPLSSVNKPSMYTNPLRSNSEAPQTRWSSTPALSPSRTSWPNMLLCSVRLLWSPVTPTDSAQSPSSMSKSAARSRTREITNGTALSCCGTQFPYVPLELPHKVGIRLDPTAPTCPFLKNSVSRKTKEEINGSWAPSTPSSS